MAITNRALDPSEQQSMLNARHGLTVNAQESFVHLIERPMSIQDMKIAVNGVSGAPTVMLRALRFTAGTGGSSFNIGSTFALTEYGTSGYLSFSLPASGSTLLSLRRGDVLMLIFGGGASAAFLNGATEIVTKNIQDIKTWF